MGRGILAICFLLVCPALVAQTPLNNSSIIKLLRSGISDDVIVSTINASTGYYNTSAAGLIALKKAGASDKVVAAIVEKNAHTAGEKPFFKISGGSPPAPSVTVPVPIAAPVAPIIPAAVDSVGVYYKDAHGSWQEVNTEVVNWKTGGVLKHLASVNTWRASA
jgi:hypothetical protein